MEPGPNGTGPADHYQEAIDALGARLEEVHAALAGYDELRAEQRKLTTALRTLNPDHPLVATDEPKPKPGPGRPKSTDRKRYGPKASTIAPVWGWIRARPEETWTAPQVEAAFPDMANGTVRRVVDALRDAEAVRLIDKQGGPRKNAARYRLLDVGAGDRMSAAIDTAQDALADVAQA